MRYRELFEAVEPVGQTFYHVTTSNRVKSIMKHGLQTGRHRRWKNQLGGHLGDRGYTYLISSYVQAVRWAAKQDWDHRASNSKLKTVILKLQNVPTEGLVQDDHIDAQLYGENTWYKTPASIPPEDIVRVIPLTPEMIKAVVQAMRQIPSGTMEEPPDEASPKMASPP